MMETIDYLLYEELSFNAHPALQTQFYDGWVLRFANGYTNRANSINLIYPSAIDLKIKIAECEKRYFMHGLPAAYKLLDCYSANIDRALEENGYDKIMPTYVMEAKLQNKYSLSGDSVVTDYADDEWLEAYFAFSKYYESVKITTAKQIHDNVKNVMFCARLVKDGVSAACGSAVIERGYAGLLNIVVDEARRGNGYGREICETLMAEAIRRGAHTAYLQVLQDNEIAVNLYKKLGFKKIYSYWYRVKKSKNY